MWVLQMHWTCRKQKRQCANVDAFAKRREVLIEGLDQIPGITYVKPEGAFYAMVDVSALG